MSNKLMVFGLFILLFNSCDSSQNVAQIGNWYASEVTRSNCANSALNGSVFCSKDLYSQSNYSCVELILQQATYSLKVKFDINTTNEIGTYTILEGKIHFCPTSPIGTCYDTPVLLANDDYLTITLTRSAGCAATVSLVRI